jgi:hypothetical protein
MFTIEYFRMEPPHTEPVIVDRVNGEFRTLDEADGQAVMVFATAQTAKGAHGYRILEQDKIVQYGPRRLFGFDPQGHAMLE